MRKTNIQNRNNLLIMEALLNNSLIKTAQDTDGGIVDVIKNYVNNNIDPDDKVGSIIDMLAPGVVFTVFGGKIGFFLGLMMRIFHVDVAGILRSIGEKVKQVLSGGKITSSDVHTIVENSVQQHNSPDTEEDAEQAAKEVRQMQSSQAVSASQLRSAKLFAISADAYQQAILQKNSAKASGIFSWFSKNKASHTPILTRILSFFVMTVLSAGELMLLGDGINKMIGRPSALDSKVRGGEPVSETGNFTSSKPKPNVNPSYQDIIRNTASTNWIESVPNNANSIGDMIVNFASDVYQGLDDKEQQIRSTPGFQHLVSTIVWYNHTSDGGPIVFIPTIFKTKKDLVDIFIDDVVPNYPAKSNSGDMKTYNV